MHNKRSPREALFCMNKNNFYANNKTNYRPVYKSGQAQLCPKYKTTTKSVTKNRLYYKEGSIHNVTENIETASILARRCDGIYREKSIHRRRREKSMPYEQG